MTRRILPLLPLALAFAADPARDTADVITGLAGALANANVRRFLAPFDPKMPGYQDLRTNVSALLIQAEVQSYLDIVSNEGDDKARKLEVAWTLRMKRTGDPTPLPDRDAHINCRLEKQGRNWRIVGFDGIAFFAP